MYLIIADTLQPNITILSFPAGSGSEGMAAKGRKDRKRGLKAAESSAFAGLPPAPKASARQDGGQDGATSGRAESFKRDWPKRPLPSDRPHSRFRVRPGGMILPRHDSAMPSLCKVRLLLMPGSPPVAVLPVVRSGFWNPAGVHAILVPGFPVVSLRSTTG